MELLMNPALRTDVPAYPGPPDRQQWEREHGVKPYVVSVPPSLFPDIEGFQHRAQATIGRDLTTLDREQALTQQTNLEHVCERVKTTLDIPESDHVFFDPQDGKFWVYPDPKRPTLSESLGKELPHSGPETHTKETKETKE